VILPSAGYLETWEEGVGVGHNHWEVPTGLVYEEFVSCPMSNSAKYLPRVILSWCQLFYYMVKALGPQI